MENFEKKKCGACEQFLDGTKRVTFSGSSPHIRTQTTAEPVTFCGVTPALVARYSRTSSCTSCCSITRQGRPAHRSPRVDGTRVGEVFVETHDRGFRWGAKKLYLPHTHKSTIHSRRNSRWNSKSRSDLHSSLHIYIVSMFSRVASKAARAPVRAAARRLSHRSAAAVSAQGSSSSAFGLAAAGALAVAAGAAAIASERRPGSVLCDHGGKVKYTGEPGTCHERSFIVSLICGCWCVAIVAPACCRDVFFSTGVSSLIWKNKWWSLRPWCVFVRLPLACARRSLTFTLRVGITSVWWYFFSLLEEAQAHSPFPPHRHPQTDRTTDLLLTLPHPQHSCVLLKHSRASPATISHTVLLLVPAGHQARWRPAAACGRGYLSLREEGLQARGHEGDDAVCFFRH